MLRQFLIFSISTLVFVFNVGYCCGADKFSNESFLKHIAKLKTRLPDGNFHIEIQKPFVVIGDGGEKSVKRWSEGTVKWAVEKIKDRYFSKNPNQIIDIWLFKDKSSYEKNCELIVGYKPHTPFGFYSSHKRVLVMNISTGGGTLVHEIVHPFIESNFPECPAWFNEGLASLYEQCGERDGQIWGKTNWRLRGLQFEIESGSLPSTKDLCSTTTRQFYDSNAGDNYAQARYLCYYLQEKGLLQEYYNQFSKNVGKDKHGFTTLKRILNVEDMEKFDAFWQKYCLALKF